MNDARTSFALIVFVISIVILKSRRSEANLFVQSLPESHIYPCATSIMCSRKGEIL